MRRRIDWKDRAAGYETPSERFCRHNGIPYRGGCGALAGTARSSVAARQARAQAIVTFLARRSTMSIAEAMADAKPTSRPKIHRISWSTKNSTLACYFEEPSLIGRRFKARLVQSERKILLEESSDGSGPAIRLVGGAKTSTALVLSLKTTPLDIADGQHEVSISPTWAHGKLTYSWILPPAIEASSAPQPTEPRMPRRETLREILNNIRRIERETPYRLERSENTDGWEFVARIS